MDEGTDSTAELLFFRKRKLFCFFTVLPARNLEDEAEADVGTENLF